MIKQEKIGIDRISITNILGREIPFSEPIISCLADEYCLDISLLQNDSSIVSHSKKLIIKGDGYDFICGNMSLKKNGLIQLHPFSCLEIHSADAEGNNLNNMDMHSLKNKFNDAIRDLNKRYDFLTFSQNIDNFLVTKMEINVTFDMTLPFHEYEDIFSLLGYGLNGKKWKKGAFKEIDNFSGKIETLYLAKKDNYTIKLYDKIKQLQEKKIPFKNSYNNLLRIEITIHKNCEVERIEKSRAITEITDEKIKKYFKLRFTDAIKKIDNYLHITMNKGLSGSHVEYPSIMVILLKELIKSGINDDRAYELFLRQIREIESQIDMPYLISMHHLKDTIDNSVLYDTGLADQIIDKIYCTCKNFPEFSSFLTREDKWNELKEKLEQL